MSISRNPLQIYRDSVLVKQQQILNSLDLVYDGYIARIREQQQEIKEQIKLLFYKEINRIDNPHHVMRTLHTTRTKAKTIKMDIFDLLSSDDSSEDIPILGDHRTLHSTQTSSENDQNNQTQPSMTASLPPLPPLSSLLHADPTHLTIPPIPKQFIDSHSSAIPPKCDDDGSIELNSILELMLAANASALYSNTNAPHHGLNELLPKLDATLPTAAAAAAAALSPLPPLIPPLPDLSTLMIKRNADDNLITITKDETNIKCGTAPTIKQNRIKRDVKLSKLSEFDDISWMDGVDMRQASIMIDKTSDCGKWKCNFCRKWIAFVSNKEIFTHLVCHRKERKFQCKYCDKVFKRKSDVKRHSKTHTGERPHKCSVCGKGFGTKYCLKTHIRTHTGEMPYECRLCGKSFRQNSHLTVHWRTHTGDKPYECKVCHKRFSQHSTLAVHYRIHNGDKPFICPCCNRPFTQRHSLQRHLRNVHKEYANKYGVDHIHNLHSLQKLRQKQLQNKIAKADKVMKRLLKDGAALI